MAEHDARETIKMKLRRRRSSAVRQVPAQAATRGMRFADEGGLKVKHPGGGGGGENRKFRNGNGHFSGQSRLCALNLGHCRAPLHASKK